MTTSIPHIISSIFYNSKINKNKFISNKKKLNSIILGVKYKQQNLSLIKRRFHTENTKNKRQAIPFFATLGAGFSGGKGPRIGPVLGLLVAYSIYNF